MSNYIKNIEVTGLYGRFDLKQTFGPGVNVLCGRNGSGKSTLLHILANALNGDHGRFTYLDFRSIKIEFDDDVTVVINQDRKQRDNGLGFIIDWFITETYIKGDLAHSWEAARDIEMYRPIGKIEPFLPTAYFPAFRTMIEAWDTVRVKEVNQIRLGETELENLQKAFIRTYANK